MANVRVVNTVPAAHPVVRILILGITAAVVVRAKPQAAVTV